MIDWINTLPPNITDAFWTIAVGAACSVACGVLGCYLVLRRLSLIGDAISHAVLPGLVLALLWTGTRNPVPMLMGAMALGVLTAFLTETLHKLGRMPTDSSMGVVFTSLFALGVVMYTVFAPQIDLDPSCVLYGALEFVVIDTVTIGALEVPRMMLTAGAALALALAFVMLIWKELKIGSFDPALATSIGFSAAAVHYLLMAMVAMTTVASFEAVGSILVVAMLIAPGATAHLLTDRLGRMLWIAAGVGVLSAVLGYWWAVVFDTTVAGMIAVAAGAQFALAVFFAPRHGVLMRVAHNASVGLRVVREDALALLWRMSEERGQPAVAPGELARAIGGGAMPRLALWRLRRAGHLQLARGRAALTDAGRREAQRLVRAHRLWETYLTAQLGHPAEDVDHEAHRIEHFIAEETVRRLDHTLEQPSHDPHGSRIPREK